MTTAGQIQDQAATGLTAANFWKTSPNGFGDPYNAYPHCMAWFRDHLYVGTTRANLAYRGRWRSEEGGEGLGQMWPVRIPEGLFDIDLRAEIWRYSPPTQEWSKVYVSPLVVGIDGFEVPLTIGFRAMTPFQGKSDPEPVLYIPTWGSHQTPYAVMLRSVDGVHFEEVSDPGLGFPDPYQPRGVRGLVPFKGRLFSSPASGPQRKQQNTSGNMVIMESADPASGKWHLACEPGFRNPNNLTVFELCPFNGYLYAGTFNVNEGCEVWKTDAEGVPPYRWKRVIHRGAYRERFNQAAMTLRAFGDFLYVGTAVQEGGIDRENKVGPISPEIIRIHADDSWDLVVGDPRLTPDGLKIPLSGMGPGFGNPFAGYLWAMCVHEGWLYAGNSVWMVALRYARQNRLPKRVRSMFTPEDLERMLEEFGGCDLWRTHDGRQWIPVTQNGFGNPYNLGIRNMVSSPYGLFVGIANPFAPEIAVKRVAGWKYEENAEGGLEIWLGNGIRENGGKHAFPAKSPVLIPDSYRRKEETGREKHRIIEQIVDYFYEGSGFRHFGFWKENIKDISKACENLMGEIAAFIPLKTGKILDVGCGFGATTRCLMKHFPAGEVTGITFQKERLKACKGNTPGAKFHYRPSPKLRVASGQWDCIVWVKGLDDLGSRERLLRESFRALKPGGTLVCFDILVSGIGKKRSERKKSAPATPEQFRNLFEKTGFQMIGTADVEAETYRAFRKYTAQYFEMKRSADEIDTEISNRVEAYLAMAGIPVRGCVLLAGRKPDQEAGT